MATMAQAIRMALHIGESKLGVTDIFGEDVGPPLGGVFTCTQGLKTAWNAPLDERGIIGCAMGLALAGQRCVAEIQFADYIFNSVDLLKLAGNCCWSSIGQFNLPMVVIAPMGAGVHGSIYHSHSIDGLVTHLAGWKTVIPSNPYDAFGLLISAIKDPNPVFYLCPKALMRIYSDKLIPGEPTNPRELSKRIDAPVDDRRDAWTPDWPNIEAFEIPIGVANTIQPGNDVSVVTYGRLVPMALGVAEKLAQENISVEVIDLRSLYPYDWECIYKSVRRTKRLLVVNEDSEITNFGEHLVRRASEELFYELECPPRLLAAKHVPGVGLAWSLEKVTIPQSSDMEIIIRQMSEAHA